jgi:hypothetical protein
MAGDDGLQQLDGARRSGEIEAGERAAARW